MHDFHPDAAGGPAFEPGLIDAGGRLRRWCKGGGAPQQTSQQKRNEKLQERLMRQQLKAAQKPIELPRIEQPPPAAPPPPPPSSTSADVTQAAQMARRQSALRTNSGRNTIFAGESTLGGMRTLLG